MRKTIQKFFLLALLAVFALPMQAQNEGAEAADTVGVKDIPTALFGFFSYNEVLEAMPDMTLLKKKMADQRSHEEEFNKKYEEFLEGQRQFAPSIYKKRQAELTDLMERNMAFKAEAQKQLQEAEQAAMAPLKAKLSAAVAKVAKQMSLAFVLNTDGDAVPYVDPVLGTDITAAVKAALK